MWELPIVNNWLVCTNSLLLTIDWPRKKPCTYINTHGWLVSNLYEVCFDRLFAWTFFQPETKLDFSLRKETNLPQQKGWVVNIGNIDSHKEKKQHLTFQHVLLFEVLVVLFKVLCFPTSHLRFFFQHISPAVLGSQHMDAFTNKKNVAFLILGGM